MNNLDPSLIELDQPSKAFAYEQISREIENCDDCQTLRNALRCYIKLYFKQQETMLAMSMPLAFE